MENLKNQMEKFIFEREEFPEEVRKVIKEFFDKMLRIYDAFQCNNGSIEDYIEGELRELVNVLDRYISEKRREEHISTLKNTFAKINEHRELMENPTESFVQIKSDNIEITGYITDCCKEALFNVQSAQSRILSANDFSRRRIDEITEKCYEMITKQLLQKEDVICDILNKDDIILQEELIQQIENYIDEKKYEKKEFRDSIKVDISLEKQREISLEIIEKQRESNDNKIETMEKEDLPGDVIV